MKKQQKYSDHYIRRMAELDKQEEEIQLVGTLLNRMLRGDLVNDYNQYLIELEETLFDNNISTDIWTS